MARSLAREGMLAPAAVLAQGAAARASAQERLAPTRQGRPLAALQLAAGRPRSMTKHYTRREQARESAKANKHEAS
jgi:hypothetical protein